MAGSTVAGHDPGWARRLARLGTVLAVTVAVWGGAGAADAHAQVSRADSAAVLYEAAERFEAEGRPEVAEALYRMVADRFGNTSLAAEARSAFARLAADAAAGGGQTELQVWMTLYGLWLGIALPGALGVDEPEPYGAGLLLGGPAGFFSGRAIGRSMSLTSGQARAITLGGSWGSWQGLGWAQVLDFGVGEVCDQNFCYEEGGASEEVFASMVVGGLAGIGIGSVLARRSISEGAATTVNFGALWGTWFGLATAIVLDVEDGDNELAAALVGGNAGLVTTALLAPRWRLTRSRARVISISGFIGALGGLGLDLIIQTTSEKYTVGIPLATSIAGLAIGALATRGGGPDRGDDAPAGAAGALLQLGQGGWRGGIPAPAPRLLEARGPDGRMESSPAVSVEWLRAVF